jgi:ribonucleoside-diphosphate reductase beta chain
MSVINKHNNTHLTSTLFLGEELGIQRYEELKYPVIDKLSEKQLSFFWLPQEIELSKDAKDFKDLTEHEKHIFTSNLKRQTLLDSVQGRSPNLALLPLTTNPELEAWIEMWSFNETIHSRSYTHILRQVFSDPGAVLDGIMDIPEIAECSDSISKYYNDVMEYGQLYKLFGEGSFDFKQHGEGGSKTTLVFGDINAGRPELPSITISKYELKKKIWLCMNAINALEGIRFYVSFACSWAFAELKKMEGNAKIIKLICRDENLHLAFTQTMLKTLPKDDPDFVKIKEECKDEVRDMFLEAVQQEKEWAAYLFKDGSMIGLNTQLLVEYIEWIAHKRMNTSGIDSPFTGGGNPLPWTEKWISGGAVQVAPQETQITSYTIGAVDMDAKGDEFSAFEL